MFVIYAYGEDELVTILVNHRSVDEFDAYSSALMSYPEWRIAFISVK